MSGMVRLIESDNLLNMIQIQIKYNWKSVLRKYEKILKLSDLKHGNKSEIFLSENKYILIYKLTLS